VSRSELKKISNNFFEIYGSIDFYSAPKLWFELQKRLDANENFIVSLKNVDIVNSAAIGLILELKSQAGIRGIEVNFIEVPKKLDRLARLSNVSNLIS
tara:strand:+ start:53 stop:346 length:294 start_codon:yes stop_codon:yes gene_type:complete